MKKLRKYVHSAKANILPQSSSRRGMKRRARTSLEDFVDELDNPVNAQKVMQNNYETSHPLEKCFKRAGIDLKRKMLLPEGAFKIIWLFQLVLLIIFYLLLVPMRLAFSETSSSDFITGKRGWFSLDVYADIVFILDILFSFITPLRNQDGELLYDRREIGRTYCKGWFWIDLAASFPFTIFGTGQTGVNKLLRVLRIFKLLRVFRMQRTLRALDLDNFVLIDKTFVRVSRLVAVLFVLLHVMACLYWGVATSETFCDWAPEVQNFANFSSETSAIYTDIAAYKVSGFTDTGVNARPIGYHECQRDWVPWKGLKDSADWRTQYLQSVFWAVTATTGKGKPLYPRTNLQTGFTSLAVIIGVLLYAVIIGSLSSALHSSDAAGARRRQKMDSVNDFLRTRNIPMSLQRRIRDFYDFSFSSQQDAGDHGLLDDLPPALRMRLRVSMNHRRIRMIPIFASCPDECVLAIIERLKGVLAVPGEYIVNSGQWGTNLYILESGRVALCIPKSGRRMSFSRKVGQDDSKNLYQVKMKEQKHLEYLGWRAELIRMKHRKRGETLVRELHPGDFFGEEALFHDVESASARCLTYCKLLVLATADVEAVANEFPVLAKSVEHELSQREQERAMVDKEERRRLSKRKTEGQKTRRLSSGSIDVPSKYAVEASKEMGSSSPVKSFVSDADTGVDKGPWKTMENRQEKLEKKMEEMVSKLDQILTLLGTPKNDAGLKFNKPSSGLQHDGNADGLEVID